MSDLRPYLEHLVRSSAALPEADAISIASAIADGGVDACQLSALLALLAARGEQASVVFAFARVFSARAVRVAWPPPPSISASEPLAPLMPPPPLLDIVGTGGDGHNSVNISTAAAVLAAAAGCTVAKHGSVSVSSRSGSADVLLCLLGAPHVPPRLAGRCLAEAGIAFLFAPLYHPALLAASPVRKALRIRTIFNILGPLLNPAGARRLVLGVFAPALLPIFAEAASRLGAEHAIIVHCHGSGGGGLDEFAPVGVNEYVEVRGGAISEPRHLDCGCADFAAAAGGAVPRYTVADLEGGSPADNAAIIRHILSGAAAWGDAAQSAALPDVGNPPHRPHIPALASAVALNTAACLRVYGKAPSVEEGYAAAMALLRSGAAAGSLARWAATVSALATAPMGDGGA